MYVNLHFYQPINNQMNKSTMQDMIENNIPTLEYLNNCDELIEFVCNELIDYPLDTVMFQGDTLEVTKTDLTYEEFGIIKGDTLVSISSSAEGFFDLHAVKSPMSFNDSFPCIVMPNYVKEELIATLKGEC